MHLKWKTNQVVFIYALVKLLNSLSRFISGQLAGLDMKHLQQPVSWQFSSHLNTSFYTILWTNKTENTSRVGILFLK